jgi:PAS domain S-box-containing protein
MADPSRAPSASPSLEAGVTMPGAGETTWLPSEDDRRFLFEANPLPLFIYDLQTLQVLDANLAAQRNYGYSHAEFCAKTILDIRPPEDIARVMESVRTTPPASRNSGVFRHLRRDGSLIHVEINSQELVFQGRRVRLVCPVDVTERVRAEAALAERQREVQELNDRLERRVHERTAALEQSNQALEQARLAADSANRAKSEFLSSMSHELRTPLNAVIGFGQLLEAGGAALTPEVHAGYVGHIVEAGRHLLGLISDVLDLAQIEAGRVSLQPEPVALGPLLDECAAMLAPLAQTIGVKVVLSVHCAEEVWADRARLKQTLLNLLSNAIKYNRLQGRVEVGCAPGAGGGLRIEVRDTGIGLDEAQLERLFEPFNRLGQERGRIEGTGIGLALTRHLVEMMGGRIGARSTAGEGSVFWIELPPVPAALPSAPPQAVSRAAAPSPATAGVATVLSVDDHAPSQLLVMEVLRQRPQVRVLAADNGDDGVRLARDLRPDLILLDNNMPGLSGPQVQALLRADPRTAHIPVIALTASATSVEVQAGLAAGYFRYLTKPIDVEQLLDAVDAALARRGGR